jgi:hypothetical protein
VTEEPADETDGAPDYADLFAGTENRAAFLDRVAAQLQDEKDDEAVGDGPHDAAEQPPGPDPVESHVTAVWPHTSELPTPGPTLPPPPPSPPTVPVPGLIDGVPWAASPSMPATPSGVKGPPPPPPTPSASTPDPEDVDELDVRTMARSDLLALSADPPVVGPSVLAVRCPAGHLTPPFAPGCRICGARVDPTHPARIPRPALGVLRRGGGDSIVLDRDIVLGRAPQASASDAAAQPNLVRIADPGVSRSHVQIVLDGWQVFVRDLGSSNGTELQLPGQPPETLRANEDYLVEPGSRIVVAGEVVFEFEVVA